MNFFDIFFSFQSKRSHCKWIANWVAVSIIFIFNHFSHNLTFRILFSALWAIKIPLENTMICGIDTFHETGAKANSVSAFVASINSNFTKWYSKAIVQNRREGNVNAFKWISNVKSLIDFQFTQIPNCYIIIFRVGSRSRSFSTGCIGCIQKCK